MKEETVDIWDCHAEKAWICITTNFGWRFDKWAVMGAGVADQLAKRYPDIRKEYGYFCFDWALHHPDTLVVPIKVFDKQKIICFATKQLNREKPWLSWQSNSTLEQIVYSCKSLVEWMQANNIFTRVYLPRPGCSNGGLQWKTVKKVIEPILPDNVIVVTNG